MSEARPWTPDLTANTTIIIDHPLRVRPFELLWSNAGLIDSYELEPSQAAGAADRD